MHHSYSSLSIPLLIIVGLFLFVTVACGDKDEAFQSTKSGEVVSIDTPVSVPKQLSPQPSPAGSQIPKETPVSTQSVLPENPKVIPTGVPAVDVDTFLDLMDKSLTEGYTYQTQVDLKVVASLENQQQEFTVALNGISDGNDYDASLKIDGNVPMNIRGIKGRIFATEPNIADIWRELPEGQGVINAPEMLTAARKFLEEPSIVGSEIMGGVDTHHMSGMLGGADVGSFIGILVGTEGDLQSDGERH